MPICIWSLSCIMEHNLSAFYNFAACERIRERSAHITKPENMGQTTGAFTFRQHVRGILAVHKKRGKRECSRCCSRQLFSSFYSRRRLLWYFQPRITSHRENVHASVTTRFTFGAAVTFACGACRAQNIAHQLLRLVLLEVLSARRWASCPSCTSFCFRRGVNYTSWHAGACEIWKEVCK